MSLVFPSVDQSKNKARVRFISQSWEMGKPDLSNTKGVKLSPGDADIQLYLPGNFEEGYGAQWGNEDLVTAGIDPSWNGVRSSAVEALQAAGQKLQGMTNAARYDLGATALPGKFLIFDQANPNILNFNFELIPRNAAEAATIESIVAAFKLKILPTYTGAVLRFPDVWNIQFLGIKGLGFPDTPGVYKGMALMAAVPSYIGNTSTLTYEDQHPVGVMLRLTFQSIKQPYLDRQG